MGYGHKPTYRLYCAQRLINPSILYPPKAGLAQLVEQHIRNVKVTSSTLVSGTIIKSAFLIISNNILIFQRITKKILDFYYVIFVIFSHFC